MLCTPKSCFFLTQSHTYLAVGQANLTVERGCSHCKQCQEVERSVHVYNGTPNKATPDVRTRLLYTGHFAVSLASGSFNINVHLYNKGQNFIPQSWPL